MNASTTRRMITVALAASAVLHLAFAEDWPRWRGPRGDGTWNAPKLPEKWPAEGLRQLWRQPVGGGDAGVIVADGRVYTMDLQKEPEEVERVLCFDAASGKPLWTHTCAVAYSGLQHGNGSQVEALSKTRAKFLVVSFTSDWLYPTYQSKEIVRALKKNGLDVSFCEIEADWGHDAFLLPSERLTDLVKGFLEHVHCEI